MYIPLQTPVPPNSPVARLVSVLDQICAVIAARGAGGLLTVPLFFLLWRRVKQTAVKAIQLAAGIAAGKPKPVTRARKTPRPLRPPTLRLPRGFAWMLKVVPGTAVYGPKLEYLFTQPELAPLVADARFRRLVNPLCQMLGIPKLPTIRPAAAAAAAAAAPAIAEPAFRGGDQPALADPVPKPGGESRTQPPSLPAAPAAA